MLVDAYWEWDIVILGPATERVEQEDWILPSILDQAAVGILHQQGVAVMDWVAKLERVNGISTTAGEFLAEL